MKPILPFIRIGALLMIIIGVLSFGVKAQCSAPSLTFHSPVLLSGTDGQVGAIYKFAEVLPGVDAQIEITDLYGGATLNNIDDSAGVGYYDAFQPYVGAGANDTSYLEWRIVFKYAGTNTDTSLACLAITGVDVDGDNSALQEFIEAATPGAIGVDPSTNLSVSFDGVRSKAISPVANIPLIDTFHLEAMFQMNFQNINSLSYRNGAITTGGAQVRQTCIYFKPFFQSWVLLAKTLTSFSARREKNSVELNWTALQHSALQYFVVQRSEDGRLWKDIGKVPVSSTGSYQFNDNRLLRALTHYRLTEVFTNGGQQYSSIAVVLPDDLPGRPLFTCNTIFNHNISLKHLSTTREEFKIVVYSLNGSQLANQTISMQPGNNTTIVNVPSSAPAGNYMLVIKNEHGEGVHYARLVKKN